MSADHRHRPPTWDPATASPAVHAFLDQTAADLRQHRARVAVHAVTACHAVALSTVVTLLVLALILVAR